MSTIAKVSSIVKSENSFKSSRPPKEINKIFKNFILKSIQKLLWYVLLTWPIRCISSRSNSLSWFASYKFRSRWSKKSFNRFQVEQNLSKKLETYFETHLDENSSHIWPSHFKLGIIQKSIVTSVDKMPILWNVLFHKSLAKIRFSITSYVWHTLNSYQIADGLELVASCNLQQLVGTPYSLHLCGNRLYG